MQDDNPTKPTFFSILRDATPSINACAATFRLAERETTLCRVRLDDLVRCLKPPLDTSYYRY